MTNVHPSPELRTRSFSSEKEQDRDTSSSSSAPRTHRLERSASLGAGTPGPKKKMFAHRGIQGEAHYQELLEQGKLRHGSIIKKRDQRRRGSEGENVVLGMDGQIAGRLPRSISQGSLSARSLSEEVSHSSVSFSNLADTPGDKGATVATATSSFTPSYTTRDRSQFDELWVIIVNGLKKKEWDARCGRLLSQLSLVKWKVYLTRYPGHAKKLAMRAQNKGADMIIAVGGDGTLDEVVDGMLRSHCLDDQGVPKAVLSVLPLGRANDFHRSMGWDPDSPNSFEDGLWRIGRGHTALIDVGKVTCVGTDGVPMASYFLNEASVGSHAKVCGRLENYGVFGKLRHTVASVMETWKHVVFKPRVDVVVSYDEGKWEHVKKLTLLAACNGCSFARGKKLSESAHPYSGCLDMVTVSSTGSLFSVGRVFQRMSEGTPSRNRHISARKCMTVDVLPSDRKGNALARVSGVSGAEMARSSSNGSMGAFAPMSRTESFASQSSLAGNSDSEGERNGSHQSAPNSLQMTPKRAVHRAQVKRLLANSAHPVEVGGTVVGELPATFAIVPNAIKIRIALVSGPQSSTSKKVDSASIHT